MSSRRPAITPKVFFKIETSSPVVSLFVSVCLFKGAKVFFYTVGMTLSISPGHATSLIIRYHWSTDRDISYSDEWISSLVNCLTKIFAEASFLLTFATVLSILTDSLVRPLTMSQDGDSGMSLKCLSLESFFRYVEPIDQNNWNIAI